MFNSSILSLVYIDIIGRCPFLISIARRKRYNPNSSLEIDLVLPKKEEKLMEVIVKQFKDSFSMCLNGVGSSCQMVNYSNVLIFTTALHFYCLRKAVGILYHVEHIVFWTSLNLLMNIFQRFVIEFSLFRLNF